MKVRFNLKSKNSDISLILLKIRYLKSEKLPFVLSTGEHVEIKFWDDQTMRAKSAITENRKRIQYQQAEWLNALLNKFETLCLDCIRQEKVKSGNLPSYKELRTYIKNKFHDNNVEVTFWEFFEAEIEQRRADPNFKPSSLKPYISSKNNFKKFETDTGNRLTWSRIDEDLLKDWQNWNLNKDIAHNTLASYYKKFCAVMNEAYKKKYVKGEPWKAKRLKIGYRRSNHAFLSPDELMKMYHYDLTGSHLEQDRDMFLFAAFTGGYRLGDLTDLDESNVVPMAKGNIIQFTAKKTNTNVSLPSSWYYVEFVKKYKGNFPTMKSGQVFNRNIKTIAEKAGLNRMVKLIKQKGGTSVSEIKPLHECVSEYTARYSFATNLYLAGVPLAQVSKLLGHSRVATTEGYVQADKLSTAMSVAGNPYFTTKPIKKESSK